MKYAMKLFAAMTILAGAATADPARLKREGGCHIDAIYQSDNGFAVHFSDCTVTIGSHTFATVYLNTNFSEGWTKAMLAAFLSAQASGAGVAVTYESSQSGNLYGLGIMRDPAHQGSIALKLLDVQISN